MPTKRRRLTRAPIQDVKTAVLHLIGYGDVPERTGPDGDGAFEALQLLGDVIHPFGGLGELQRLWQRIGPTFLQQWIEEHPGTRPYLWWCLDAPRWRFPHLAEWNVGRLPEPRRHVGGSGRPDPTDQRDGLPFAIPVFIGGDPADPPRVESQATYLRRHRLLTSGERARLTAKDFAPETVDVTEDTQARHPQPAGGTRHVRGVRWWTHRGDQPAEAWPRAGIRVRAAPPERQLRERNARLGC
jgi:hypothetical protein